MRATILATILAAALCLPAFPAAAQPWRTNVLPDKVEFGLHVEEGDLARAKAWLEHGLSPEFLADRIGTGLMIAAWQGNIPMMELFVAHGADVNTENALGEQALMHAAWRGHADAVAWLLAHGAQVNRPPKQWSALHYAAFAGNDAVVRELVSRGADLDARSTNGSTALMMAVYDNHESTVRALLALGAARDLKNDLGEGAMDWAFKHERLAIARLVGSAQDFAAAANRPKAQWAPATQSVAADANPVTDAGPDTEGAQIDDLLEIRKELEARKLYKQVHTLDRRIAYLRARRAKPSLGEARAAVLEITASRTAPRRQKVRLVREPRRAKQ